VVHRAATRASCSGPTALRASATVRPPAPTPPRPTPGALLTALRGGAGDSAALVAVFGPTGASKRQEIVNRAAIEVVYKPLSSAPGAAEKEKESVLRQIAEAAVMTQLHPRTVVQIVVQELNNDGSMLAVVINAMCVALLDAGVPLRHSFVAAAVATRMDGSVLLDPAAADEAACRSSCTFAYQVGGAAPPAGDAAAAAGGTDFAVLSSVPGGCEVVGAGGVGDAGYWEALAAGRAAARQVEAFVRKHTEHHYARVRA